MIFIRICASTLLLLLCLSCAALDHREDTKATVAPIRQPSGNVHVDQAGREVPTPVIEPGLSWSDLTRLAREHLRRGELAEAQERLGQAALQVQPLAPTHVQRQTVFGLRARLAMHLADEGEIERADELAEDLFTEAGTAPELGGAALVSLALSVADRTQSESQLPFLRIALTTAQTGTTSLDRMNLAFRVADTAYREQDFALARRAIDQSVADARQIGPTKKKLIASLELFRSRVALAQMDLETAQTSATAANQLFAEISVGASNRGIAEATLAEILARKGEIEKALAIARGAHARIGGEESIDDHAQRLILGSLARVEEIAGDFASARLHFERAVVIPAVDFAPDVDLVEQLRIELQELDDAATPSSLPSTPERPPEVPSDSE